VKKRLLVKIGLLAALALLGFGAYVWWTTPTSGVNWATANRIQIGMTQDEVIGIIGKHPTASKLGCGPGPTQVEYEWHSANNDGELIIVLLDSNGKVIEKTYNSEFVTFLDKVRHWLHLN